MGWLLANCRYHSKSQWASNVDGELELKLELELELVRLDRKMNVGIAFGVLQIN